MMDGAKVDETSHRRSGQDMCNSESEQQQSSRLKPTVTAIPFPSILVGYVTFSSCMFEKKFECIILCLPGS